MLRQIVAAAASSSAPSAPPVASHDQALRTTFDSLERDEAADDDSPQADAAETTNGQQTLTEVHHRFRHIVEAPKD